MMRIDVAGSAGSKLHVFEPCRPAGMIRFVAFFARHLDVQTCERIAGFRMIELFRGLPIAHVVAALTILAELALVIVLVAGNANRG